jgi:hypothetical protein
VSVPDEGYSRNVPDEGYSRNVPDEGYLSTTTLEQNRQDSRQSKQYFNLKKKQKQKKT